MSWTISVTNQAAAQIRALDAGLRDELIDAVDTLSESPAAHLFRPMVRGYGVEFVTRYRSAIAPDLTVELHFRDFDAESKRLTLLYVLVVAADSDPSEAK